MKSRVVVCICLTLLTGSQCFKWGEDLADGDTVYACPQQDVTLSWTVSLAPGESIKDIRWLYHGSSDILIATYTAGFLLVTPSFTGRVQQAGDAGLQLDNVIPADAGSYTVQVYLDNGGTISILSSAAQLSVLNETTAAAEVVLQASEAETPVYDSATAQFHIQLECQIHGQKIPITSVVWTTPAGAEIPDTDNRDNVFSLRIPNPVKGGTYTCRVGSDNSVASCLPPDHPARQGVPITVVEMESRLALLEVQQMALMEENTRLKDISDQLRNCSSCCPGQRDRFNTL